MEPGFQYGVWAADKMWTFVPAQAAVAEFLDTFKEFPRSQKSGAFIGDQVLQQLQCPGGK